MCASSRRGSVAPLGLLYILLLGYTLLSGQLAHALTYHFVDGKPICFSEVLDDRQDSIIIGEYDWKPNSYAPASQVRLVITAQDSKGSVYYKKEMSEGEHSFMVQPTPEKLGGEHLVCFTASPKFVIREEKAVKVRIQLDRGLKEKITPEKVVAETAQKRRQIDGLDVYAYQDAGGQQKEILQPRAYLQSVEAALSAMESTLDQLFKELSTSVSKETRMRQTSESTFTRVWVCALLLIGVIFAVLWMQFHFLKTTLRKRKLV